MESSIVSLLVQAGAVGLCFVGLYLLWHFWRSAREEREKLHAQCIQERAEVANSHMAERDMWTAERARLTDEMLKLAGIVTGAKNHESSSN